MSWLALALFGRVHCSGKLNNCSQCQQLSINGKTENNCCQMEAIDKDNPDLGWQNNFHCKSMFASFEALHCFVACIVAENWIIAPRTGVVNPDPGWTVDFIILPQIQYLQVLKQGALIFGQLQIQSQFWSSVLGYLVKLANICERDICPQRYGLPDPPDPPNLGWRG